MRTFFKIFFASLLAIVVALLLVFFIMFGVVASVGSSDKPIVKKQTVLYIDLSTPVLEQERSEDFDFLNFTTDGVLSLRDQIKAIENAATDTSVKAIYLLCRGNAMGFAATQEVGVALEAFKESGKPIVAMADVMTQRAYEIANKATHVYVQPGGLFEWTGYSLELTFFKNALDKLDLKPEIFYAGQFKSATEPFRLTKMSEANKLQYVAFLNGLYSQMMQSVKKHRGLDSSTLTGLANTLAVRTSEQAIKANLIDGVLYEDEVRDTLRSLIGLKKDADISFMNISAYSEATTKTAVGDRIAVLYADGSIVGGKGDRDDIGADTYRSEIAKLRSDNKVKAVVLRVNSPGGSAIASELIWRELMLLKKEKPLIVSMGDYAASGGYYIACVADTIFAMPNTLTGSIGVFSIYFDAQGLLNDRLGLSFDGISTAKYADFGTVTRPMSTFEKQIAQQDVDTIYQMFKKRVMDGRSLSAARVDSIAQGRIWSGNDALAIGLVDKIGTLEQAIECAAAMAKLEKYSVRTYPAVQSFIDKLLDKKDPNTTEMKLMERTLSPTQMSWIRQYKQFAQMANSPQMRLPFVINP